MELGCLGPGLLQLRQPAPRGSRSAGLAAANPADSLPTRRARRRSDEIAGGPQVGLLVAPRGVQHAYPCGVALVVSAAWQRRRRRQRALRLAASHRLDVAPVDSETDAVLETTLDSDSSPTSWLQRHLPPADRRWEGGVDAQELLVRFLAALEERGVELYQAQEEAILDIFTGAHVVLDTPTGTGKSLVAVAAFFKAMGQGRRAFYTSPTKALVSEKFFDLCRHFGSASVGMATGDVSVNMGAPLICCTAEVLSNIALRDGLAARAQAVVMDEFHYFGDRDRGAAWEIPLWRLPQAAFVLMSGTLGENSGLYQAIEARTRRPLQVISSCERPVPLVFSYRQQTLRAALEDLVEAGRFPVYVVHFSQLEALRLAKGLAEWPFARLPDGRGAALQAALQEVDFGSPFGPQLRGLLLRGVGVHHAGLLPRYRRLVETLAQASLLTVISGTDTLGVGINMPIRSVVFARLCKFDGKDTRLLSPREFLQIAGRAGRKGFDERGDVVAVAPEWESFNQELEQRVRQGSETRPAWKRPPRGDFKQWTERTFLKLQRRAPDTLRSRFQLNMGQVLTLLQGAAARGSDGDAELRDLIDCSRCLHSERQFWHRQADKYLDVLQGVGLRPTAQAEQAASLHEPGGEGAVDAGLPPQQLGNARGQDLALPDDASLFLVEALAFLEQHLASDELPVAVFAAVESLCEAPPPILCVHASDGSNIIQGQRPFGACPALVSELLLQCFSNFQERNPWVAETSLQPRGLALEAVLGRLSFAQVVGRLSKELDGERVVCAEGTLLRYFADVCRMLRLSVPAAFKTQGVATLERRLQTLVHAVDSSLLDEWARLQALRGLPPTAAADPADVLGAGAGAGGAGGAGGGAMVPRGRAAGGWAPRSRAELEAWARERRASLDAARREQAEAMRLVERSVAGRARRLCWQAWATLGLAAGKLIDKVW